MDNRVVFAGWTRSTVIVRITPRTTPEIGGSTGKPGVDCVTVGNTICYVNRGYSRQRFKTNMPRYTSRLRGYTRSTYAKNETRQYVRRRWNNAIDMDLGVLDTSIIYSGWQTQRRKNPLGTGVDGRIFPVPPDSTVDLHCEHCYTFRQFRPMTMAAVRWKVLTQPPPLPGGHHGSIMRDCRRTTIQKNRICQRPHERRLVYTDGGVSLDGIEKLKIKHNELRVVLS